MKFRLLRAFLRDLHLDHDSDPDDSVNAIRYSPVYRDDKQREFAVVFDLVQHLPPAGLLKLNYIAVFETEGDIDPVFKEGLLPRVNAPAVAYPYLRALVSQFSALAGLETCTLPIKNFVKDGASPALPAAAE
jgi:preprotein translocase subunit SecB